LKDGDVFLSRIITGDETWAHHYDPMKKIRSMEWRRQSPPRKKKLTAETFPGKVMAIVFRDSKWILLLEFSERGATIDSERVQIR
jgi:hypothetical protein